MADSETFRDYPQDRTVVIDGETRKTVWNLANGVLSPLKGFMDSDQYLNVLDNMRLDNDLPWTLPIILGVADTIGLRDGEDLLLVDEGRVPVAVLKGSGTFSIDKRRHARKAFGTEDQSHPGVAKVFAGPDSAIGGKLIAVAKPDYGPFADYTLTPKETRVLFTEKRWKTTVAFQTRNAPHINHEYLQKAALGLVDGLFINPVLGKKKAGDFRDEVILAAYRALVTKYYPKDSVVMSVLHYEMQYAGPREAIMHAIMRKNFGCTHIIIGRDHAGVGNFYAPFAAQEIFQEFPDLGISPLFFKEFYYCRGCGGIASERTCPHSDKDRLNFSGTKLRQMFTKGETPPKEFMRPEVAQVILSHKNPFVD
jgi:sulfate adenylyltransferase